MSSSHSLASNMVSEFDAQKLGRVLVSDLTQPPLACMCQTASVGMGTQTSLMETFLR